VCVRARARVINVNAVKLSYIRKTARII